MISLTVLEIFWSKCHLNWFWRIIKIHIKMGGVQKSELYVRRATDKRNHGIERIEYLQLNYWNFHWPLIFQQGNDLKWMYILNGHSEYTVDNQLWKAKGEVRKVLERFDSFQWERTMTDVMVNFVCSFGSVMVPRCGVKHYSEGFCGGVCGWH